VTTDPTPVAEVAAAASRVATVAFRDIVVARDGRWILCDVSFDIRAGERTALVGPNGGGKTTLVRVMLGLLKPFKGSVAFLDPTGAPLPKPRIGYLSQRSTLSPDAPVSGMDLIRLELDPRPGLRPAKRLDDEARAALSRAGLSPELFERPVGQLSGGQRQRVLLARALAGSPPILVLDEPDTALDAEGMKTLRRIVAEEVNHGRAVIYVTHDSDSMGGADAIWRVDGTVRAVPVS
jgi:manganese/iron transport system ATP-binding protein